MNICTDPWTDGDQTYFTITHREAQRYLKEALNTQKAMDLDPEESIPEDISPALFRELYNEIAKEHNKEVSVSRLAEYIEDNCCVAEYDSFIIDFYHENKISLQQVCPMDWLNDDIDPFELNALPVPDMVMLVRNSPSFNLKNEYYTLKDNKLISTNNPFKDGITDAEQMAQFLVDRDEDYGNDDFRKILNGEEVE